MQLKASTTHLIGEFGRIPLLTSRENTENVLNMWHPIAVHEQQ